MTVFKNTKAGRISKIESSIFHSITVGGKKRFFEKTISYVYYEKKVVLVVFLGLKLDIFLGVRFKREPSFLSSKCL